MVLKRNVGIVQGLKYQGGLPMLFWILHRISGLGILLLVGTHVLVSFVMQQLGSGWATDINVIYESWGFQIFVIFCVVFHALNGLRIALLDIWPQAQQFQHEAMYLELAIFIPVYGLTIFILIQRGLIGS